MKIDQGQFVRCSLSSGIVVSGKVEQYSSQEIILFSLDQQKILIIHDPKMVILTEILLHPPKSPQQIQEIKQDFTSQMNQTFLDNEPQQEVSNDQIKNLAQLRQELLQSEREVVANKLNKREMYTPGALALPSYDQLSIFQSGHKVIKK